MIYVVEIKGILEGFKGNCYSFFFSCNLSLEILMEFEKLSSQNLCRTDRSEPLLMLANVVEGRHGRIRSGSRVKQGVQIQKIYLNQRSKVRASDERGK